MTHTEESIPPTRHCGPSLTSFEEILKKRKGIVLLVVLSSAFTIRIWNVNAPLLDHFAWRQATDILMAENYYRSGYATLLTPQVVGTTPDPQPYMNEFPTYPYIVSLFFPITGPTPIWGRLISILATLAGLYWLFRLIEETDGSLLIGCTATMMMNLSPLLVFYGQSHQRNALVIALIVGTMYECVRYLDTKSYWRLFLCSLYGMLAVLTNAPSVYMGLGLIYLVLRRRGRKGLIQPDLILLAFVIVAPGILWYQYALATEHSVSIPSHGREYLRDFGNPAYYFRWFSEDFFTAIWKHVLKVILTPAAIPFFIVGLLSFRGINKLPLVWLISVLIYFALDVYFIAIHIHDYYYLNVIPPLVWIAARGMNAALVYLEHNRTRVFVPVTIVVVLALLFSYTYRIGKIVHWFSPNERIVGFLDTIHDNTVQDDIVILDEIDDSLSYNLEIDTYKVNEYWMSLDIVESLGGGSEAGRKPTHLHLTKLDHYKKEKPGFLVDLSNKFREVHRSSTEILYSLKTEAEE